MRLHRFYIGSATPVGHSILIEDKELAHQWKNVFRMKVGSDAILFGKNQIEYTARISFIDKKSASFEILSEEKIEVSPRKITLCAALIKKDNFEIIIQKAVEIGVTTIIPIISDRSEKKFLNKERAERIIIEAAEQCGRVDIPTLTYPVAFDNVLATLPKDSTIIGFEPTGTPFDAKVFSRNNPALFIGPEGGWTEEEIEKLKKVGIVMNLPTYILRAETAAITALSLSKILA